MCLPALGGRIKMETDEIEKPDRAYMLAIPTSAKQSQNVESATKINNGINT